MHTNSPPCPIFVAGTPPPADAYDADIIILTIGRCQDTIAAVTSALAQKNAVCQVILLDQGSSPETRAAFIAAFGHAKGFTLYVTDENLGVGGGRNFLSSAGRGRIIVALDNDARFADDLAVSRALTAFDRNPRLGAIGFKILRADGQALDHYSWGYPERLKPMADECFNTTTFVGAGHAIRRSTWHDAGGYDSRLFFTWEEYDFCLRAIARNWLVTYQGSIRVLHNLSADARIGWSSMRMQYYVRNRLLIARKWGVSWPALAPLIAGYLLRGLMNNLFLPTIKGILAALTLSGKFVRTEMPPDMRRYIRRNEKAHRGPLYHRIRDDVLRILPADP